MIIDALFNGTESPRKLLEEVGRTVYDRLVELEVSPDGLDAWRRLLRSL